MKALNAADYLPSGWPLEEVQSLASTFVNRFLVPPALRLKGVNPQGLVLESVAVLQGEFQYWMANQKIIDTLYQTQAVVRRSDILGALKAQVPSSNVLEMMRAYQAPLELPHDSEGRVQIGIKSQVRTYLQSSLNITNLGRSLVRWVIRAYAQTLERTETNPLIVPNANASLSLAEAQKLYNEVKGILIALKKIDPSNVLFPDKRFREANLFTRNSNGEDGFLSFDEGLDLFLHLFSGIVIDGKVTQELKQQCPPTGRLEGEPRYGLDCYVRVYHRSLQAQLASIGLFRDHLKAMQYSEVDPLNSQFGKAMIDLLKASGTTNLQSGDALSSDLSLVPHAMQFIESVLQRYDENADGRLDKNEGLNSLPTFLPTLKRLGGFKEEKTNRALLAYILEHGKPPTSTGEKLKFYFIYQHTPGKWKINADRMQITTILSYIAEAAGGAVRNIESESNESEANDSGNALDLSQFRTDFSQIQE